MKEKDKELDRDQGEKILEKGKEKEKDKEREKERDKDRKLNGISSKDKSNETETAGVKNKSVSQQDKESLLHAESFRKEGKGPWTLRFRVFLFFLHKFFFCNYSSIVYSSLWIICVNYCMFFS